MLITFLDSDFDALNYLLDAILTILYLITLASDVHYIMYYFKLFFPYLKVFICVRDYFS